MKVLSHLKQAILIAGIAAIHLTLCKLIVSAVRAIIDTEAYQIAGIKVVTQILIVVTKILYFPLLSLSLYSRQYFPGDLIYIVIFSNSMIWAVAIYVGYRLYRKIKD